MPSEQVRYCLENAKRWERMASGVRDRGLKVAYDFSAGQWQRLAEEIERAEKTDGAFVPADSSISETERVLPSMFQ
jgi:hypothetical protein